MLNFFTVGLDGLFAKVKLVSNLGGLTDPHAAGIQAGYSFFAPNIPGFAAVRTALRK